MLSFILLVVGVLAQLTFAEEPEAMVNGQSAVQGEFPYQVSLKKDGYHICGGSIINTTKILTAAHCVNKIANPYNNLKIVTGTINAYFKKGQFHNVTSIRVHPKFSNGRKDDITNWVNDVAVITLSKPIQYDKYQKPIALTETIPVEGQDCTLSGWNRTELGNRNPNHILQKTNQVVISLKECQKRSPCRNLTEGHMCAYNRFVRTCKGDSGGPLVSNGVQIGILSWTTVYCTRKTPDIYADVYHYRDFILSS